MSPNPPQDATEILSLSRLSTAIPDIEDKALTELAWIIEVTPADNGKFTRQELWSIFDTDWRIKYEWVECYGHSTEDGRWHNILGGRSKWYDQLQITWQLADKYKEDDVEWDLPSLEEFRDNLLQRLTSKFPDIHIRELEDIPSALKKAQILALLKKQFNHDSILVIKSAGQYSGKQAWDVLISLGLEWDDAALFHWNVGRGQDHRYDQLFSVWTTSPPGYFDPEKMKAGAFNPIDLVFGFNIPRCVDPINVFNCMVDAAEYCQKILGGTIVNAVGTLFDKQTQKINIIELIDDMHAKGILPGTPLTLKMF